VYSVFATNCKYLCWLEFLRDRLAGTSTRTAQPINTAISLVALFRASSTGFCRAGFHKTAAGQQRYHLGTAPSVLEGPPNTGTRKVLPRFGLIAVNNPAG
jgi:hypothetical protein